MNRNIKHDRLDYIVTTLEDTGTLGSLRYGCKINEPVYITFAVHGVIELKSRLWVYRDFCTIDGESAPGPVIIMEDTLYLRGSSLCVRYVTMCANSLTRELDSVWALLCNDVLIEYCTIIGGSDEIVSATKSDNVTIRNCIIANPMDQKHAFGSIVSGVDEHSVNYFQNNLIVNCSGRTPRAHIGNLIISGNRIYNFGHLLTYSTDLNDAVIIQVNNIYKPGPQTIRDNLFVFPSKPSNITLLIENNIIEGDEKGSNDNSLRIKNLNNGVLLDYKPSNGRFKIIPQKKSYLSKKVYKKLYHRIDKLAKNLIFDKVKDSPQPSSFEDGLDQIGNWKHRTSWDYDIFTQISNQSSYSYPTTPFSHPEYTI